jgi:hypothetical protein
MVRYALFVIVVLGSAATAVASIAPGTAINNQNVTFIEKNQNWHVVNSVTVQICGKEDCSDTPQG